jgi:hypothetical protein
LRVASNDRTVLLENIGKSEALRDQMWAIEAAAAQSGYSADLMSSLGDTLTEIATVAESREIAALYARVPESVIWLLLVGSWLSLAMLGYSAGLTRRRSLATAAILIVVLGIVTTLVVDLDRPQDGFLRVSQQALLDVQAFMEARPPAS